MKNVKKTFLYVLLCYVLIPFVSSIPILLISLTGAGGWEMIFLPALMVLPYVIFRKKLDLGLCARINGWILAVLLLVFTVLMLAGDGNVRGFIVSAFSGFILPFAPVMLIRLLMDQYLLLYGGVLASFGVVFLLCAVLSKLRFRRFWLPALGCLFCLLLDTGLYFHQDSIRYAGHGFDYMHGYSSTDFTDYMVYSENSKLVQLDHPASLWIENESDMPVMDGAEACYPLYAALAKAVYKDIDQIELQWLEEGTNEYFNGKIVSFTNTVTGFNRLLIPMDDSLDQEKYGRRVDLFFGARPSREQMQYAKDEGIELEITPIGKEAFIFFVEEDNPVESLTSQQVKDIYSGKITNWKEVGGKNQPIVAFQRPEGSGSQTMMIYFMGDTPLKEPKTYEKVSAMDGVIRQVAQYANEAGAMGYSFRYFLEELNQEQHVKMLKIDGVYPSIESIEEGTYPLTVDLCLVTRKNDPNPYVQQMIDFILSEDGQEIIRKTGYGGIR